jgi:hypothetical protein
MIWGHSHGHEFGLVGWTDKNHGSHGSSHGSDHGGHH